MKPTFTIMLIGLAPAILCGCSKDKSTSAADEVQSVSVAEPAIQDIVLYNEYPGYLTANTSVDVLAKVDGLITAKLYESGADVKEGQVLFSIDPTVYRNRVEEAQAALATAQSQADYAREHYEAVKKALESDAVSKMEVVQAEADYEQAVASIKTARAQLETAQKNLGYCQVKAPITGTATSDIIGKGNYVTGEASPVKLATIYDNTSMTANFSIEDEGYLELLKARESNDSLDFEHVPVTFSEPLGHEYTAHVTYMAPNMQKTTGTMAVQCGIPNPYDELREGMFVKVKLPYARKQGAVLIEDAAIGSDQLGKYVYVVNDSSKVVYTPVQLGDLYNDSLRIVNAGLKAGDRYVTKALLKVRNGMKVNPVK